jgi:type IV pilus assembly protein PilB
MADMGVDPFMVSSSTLLVSAQRLMRRLCEHCREPLEAPRERLLSIGCTEADIEAGPTLFRAVGCPRCSGGYTGRFAILETLPIREDVKRLIVDGRSALEIRTHAVENGMITLRRCGLLNALRGKTTIDEVLRVTLDDRRRIEPRDPLEPEAVDAPETSEASEAGEAPGEVAEGGAEAE